MADGNSALSAPFLELSEVSVVLVRESSPMEITPQIAEECFGGASSFKLKMTSGAVAVLESDNLLITSDPKQIQLSQKVFGQSPFALADAAVRYIEKTDMHPIAIGINPVYICAAEQDSIALLQSKCPLNMLVDGSAPTVRNFAFGFEKWGGVITVDVGTGNFDNGTVRKENVVALRVNMHYDTKKSGVGNVLEHADAHLGELHALLGELFLSERGSRS